jgi:hypothetical protein
LSDNIYKKKKKKRIRGGGGGRDIGKEIERVKKIK